MNAVEIQGLSYHYPDGTPALADIHLTVRENTRLALLGANGSGKTTLMMHLNGLNAVQEGSVKILGESVEPRNLRSIRQKVGVLFDNPDNQLFSTTVADDVAFGPFNMGCPEEEIETRTARALEQVGIAHLAERPPHNLSLGQKKKAAIAGLLAMDLRLFVMDEPFSGLDPVSVMGFLDILHKLHGLGSTLVISTHDVDLAYSWADEIAVVSEGRIVACGGPDILHNESLTTKWSLRLPMLYQAFCDTAHSPRTPEEARKVVRGMQPVALSI